MRSSALRDGFTFSPFSFTHRVPCSHVFLFFFSLNIFLRDVRLCDVGYRLFSKKQSQIKKKQNKKNSRNKEKAKMPSSKDGISLPQLLKAEEVVRYERERRESKQRLLLLDSFLSDLDEQLLYVAQFKKEWIRHREALEEERQSTIREEAVARKEQEKECFSILLGLHEKSGGRKREKSKSKRKDIGIEPIKEKRERKKSK